MERVLADLSDLGVLHLRTNVSWADWHTERGQEWYEWLLPRLAQEVDVLPCLSYTPPSLAVAPRPNAPPRQAKRFAEFVDVVISRFGRHFDWMELWNRPNDRACWDWTLDPRWDAFAEMVSGAAHWAQRRGKRTLLGGMAPIDPSWLEMMFERGVMEHFDAVAVHGFPGAQQVNWDSWEDQLQRVQSVIDRHASGARVWITEVGASTWRKDEVAQLRALLDVLDQRAERIYWRGAQDRPRSSLDGPESREDERELHLGLRRVDGSPKLLHRLWHERGLEGLRDAAWLTPPVTFDPPERPVVIVGGAGFVGVNLAHALLSRGERVLILDNLVRPGTYRNLEWLRSVHGARARVRILDVRDDDSLRIALQGASAVFHLAAQVAVTTSLVSPRDDFEVNALGALNVLEALRSLPEKVPLVFTSTNKVYGAMRDVDLERTETRYAPLDPRIREHGVNEQRPLDFHSPYGCSKGAADQYVLDYARVFRMPNVVFRMSCVYGPHQHGTEDQGWVAHFLLQSMRRKPITVYGDGCQVRDVLFVEDLVDAFFRARDRAHDLAGQAFNVGGGPRNTLSLRELVERIPRLQGRAPEVAHADWRPGDQPYYVSDVRAFQAATGWAPRTSVDEGLSRLQAWLEAAQAAGASAPAAAAEAAVARRG